MHIHVPTVDIENAYFQRLDFSEDFILKNGCHYTLYILVSLLIFLVVILIQLNRSAVKRRPVPSVLVFYHCLMM